MVFAGMLLNTNKNIIIQTDNNDSTFEDQFKFISINTLNDISNNNIFVYNDDQVYYDDVEYSPSLDIYVCVSRHNILYSENGIDWFHGTHDNYFGNKHPYINWNTLKWIEELDIFIVSRVHDFNDDYFGIFVSIDGKNWIKTSITGTLNQFYPKKISYSSDEKIIVLTGTGNANQGLWKSNIIDDKNNIIVNSITSINFERIIYVNPPNFLRDMSIDNTDLHIVYHQHINTFIIVAQSAGTNDGKRGHQFYYRPANAINEHWQGLAINLYGKNDRHVNINIDQTFSGIAYSPSLKRTVTVGTRIFYTDYRDNNMNPTTFENFQNLVFVETRTINNTIISNFMLNDVIWVSNTNIASNGYFVASGEAPYQILYSTNGIEWFSDVNITSEETNHANNIIKITHGNNGILGIGLYNDIRKLIQTDSNYINTPAETIDLFDESLYTRNVQTFQYSGTFIMSMNDASWDGVAPLSSGYDSNSNITYNITTSSSGGTTTVYVAYQYINTFDPTSNINVPGLRLNGKSYYYNMGSNNFTIVQFDYIPLDIYLAQMSQEGGTGLAGLTISATDVPYIQKNTNLTNFYRQGKNLTKEGYEWTSKLDMTNCYNISQVFFQGWRNNYNYNGWNINNNVSLQIRTEAYEAFEKFCELGYNPKSYTSFPNVSGMEPYYDNPNYNIYGVTRTGGANNTDSMYNMFLFANDWNNGHEPWVGNALTWVFCHTFQRMTTMFMGTKCNVRLSEPFISPENFRAFEGCTYWNNGYAPGEYWSLKDHKWCLALLVDGWGTFKNTAFAGDFAGIRSPSIRYASSMFRNCDYFNSDLTDFIESWQNTYIHIDNIITNCGLSVENYSKFLIAIKQSYDNNNSRFHSFGWNINQHYNRSASSARDDLVSIFPNQINDLGLQ